MTTTRTELAKWELRLAQERKLSGTGAIRVWVNVRGEEKSYIVGKNGDYKNALAFINDRMFFLNNPDLLAHELGFPTDRDLLRWCFKTIAAKDGGMQALTDMLMDSYQGEVL